MKNLRILVLGGTGMLGHVIFRYLHEYSEHQVFATVRHFEKIYKFFTDELCCHLTKEDVDAEKFETVKNAIKFIRPDIVINCIGIVKQLPISKEPLTAITLNAQLPHQIAKICHSIDSRMIQISTDCIFDGKKGMYTEQDNPTANDLYGMTKFLGEVAYPHCITLRTSIIGHELKDHHGLVDWFLRHEGTVSGYKKAIFSGFPTVELAKIIRDFIITKPVLSGIYHVASAPITKYDLLSLISKRYKKNIDIEPYDDFVQDRSLNSEFFRYKTGYVPPSWEDLVDSMYEDYTSHKEQYRHI